MKRGDLRSSQILYWQEGPNLLVLNNAHQGSTRSAENFDAWEKGRRNEEQEIHVGPDNYECKAIRATGATKGANDNEKGRPFRLCGALFLSDISRRGHFKKGAFA